MAVIDIRKYGAVEGTLCTAAIEAAANALRANDEFWIPPGRWRHHKTGPIGLLRIWDKPGVTLRVDGVLELEAMSYKGDVRQIDVQRCPGFHYKGIGFIHGNQRAIRAGGFLVDEQTHGLHIGEGCDDIWLENPRAIEPWGDGLRFLGTVEKPIRRSVVDDFYCFDFNRSGAAFQRGYEDGIFNRPVIVSGDRGGQCIDGEPTGTGAPRRITINDPVLVRKPTYNGKYPKSYTASGSSTLDPSTAWHLNGGSIYGDFDAVDTADLVMENMVIHGSPLTNVPALYLHKLVRNATLRNMRIHKPGGIALMLAWQTGAGPVNFLAEDVRLFGTKGALVERGQNITFRECRATGDGAVGGFGFRARAIDEDFNGFYTERCRASGFETGLIHAASTPYKIRVRETDNDFSGCAMRRRDFPPALVEEI